MNCEGFKELLVGFIYNDIEAGDRRRVEEHLKGCPACQREKEALEGTASILGRWEDADPGFRITFHPERKPAFWQAVKKWVKPPRPSWNWGYIFGGAVAVLLVVLLLVGAEVSVEEGRFSLSLGISEGKGTVMPPQPTAGLTREELADFQVQTLLLVDQLLEVNNEKQHREFALTLAAFATNLEQQRRSDFDRLGSGLREIRRVSDNKIRMTNMILEDLIRLIETTNVPSIEKER